MSLISDQQVRQFHEQGYFVTEPMFESDQLAALCGEFDRLHAQLIRETEAATRDANKIDIARHRPFIQSMHAKSAVAAEFTKAPIYLEACRRLIGPDADLYFNQAVIKPPSKGKAFAWHQDSGYRVTEPMEYITCWTAMGRTFLENGCIWVIPGSHQWGLVEHRVDEVLREKQAQFEDESAAIPVEMSAGQVAIFSSLTLHRSGPNTSSEIRRGFVPQYHHPGVVDAKSGQPTGDGYPVLRDGERVDVAIVPAQSSV